LEGGDDADDGRKMTRSQLGSAGQSEAYLHHPPRWQVNVGGAWRDGCIRPIPPASPISLHYRAD
jgi:hypothetical protein